MQQRTTEAPQKLLKIPEAAEILGLSLRSTRNLIEAGKLPTIRVSTRCVRIDPADLRRYIDSRRGR